MSQQSAKQEEEARYVASFIEHSRKARQDYELIWQETLQNYLVRPWTDGGWSQSVDAPLYTGRHTLNLGSTSSGAVLKDPESHQIVESLLASEDILLFGDNDFIKAKPVGYEDAVAASTVNRLLHRVFTLEGHYRSLHEWRKDSKIFGLGILEAYWDYRTQPVALRTLETIPGVDEFGNPALTEVSSETYTEMPVYDDVKMRPVDLFDFFWDPGNYRIIDMVGCAKRFTVTEHQANKYVEEGRWDRAAVARAVEHGAASDSSESQDKDWRKGLDRPLFDKTHESHKPMVGYCYYGRVPYKTSDGISWRRVEVLNGETVRSEPWYGRIPFFEVAPCPIQGRFPGIAPIEVIRFSQDFADAILMLSADAATSSANPPHIVDRYADVNLSALKRFHKSVPILANRVDAVSQVPYRPQLNETWNMFSNAKSQMREGSGALGVTQGLGLGVDRASATEAAGTMRQASGRPESQAMLTEREYLPPLGKYVLQLNQRYIIDTEDLIRRVGAQPEPAPLAAILADFDIEFVGSRLEGSRQQRIQAYQTLFAQGANPYLAPLIPWAQSAQRFFKELGLYEEAAAVGTQIEMQTLMANMQQIGPMAGNGNGTAPALPPAGMSPEQLGGTTVEQ